MAILPDEAPTSVVPAPSRFDKHRATRRRRLIGLAQRYGRSWVRDLAAAAGYLAAALWVLGHLVVNPNGRILAANGNDQAFFEWTLAHGARVLTHGANPFFTDQLGAPVGVNMMANTSILGLSLPMAPLTLLFGVRVAFLLLLLFALVATPVSWYALFTRALRLGRGASFLGAALCGLGPAMVSHANAHPNIVAQFLLPWIFWQLLKLARGVRPVRTGLILAGLVVWQFFINEELLFITGLAFAVFGVAWLVQRPVGWRLAVPQLLRGLILPLAIVLPLLAYPLFVQFFGAQHYHGLTPRAQDFGADVTSFYSFASRSLGGNPLTTGHVAQNAAEENTFFGIPLLLVLGLFGWYLRRRPVVPALAVTAGLLGLLSLGVHLRVQGRLTTLPGPYFLLRHVLLFDTVVPTRLALALTPIAGVLFALGWAQMSGALRAAQVPAGIPLRGIVAVLLAGALLTVAPVPLRASGAPPVPGFITSGEWRGYVPTGMSLVTVPLPQPYLVAPMHWAALTGDDLRLAGGYFLGPTTDPAHPGDQRAVFTPTPRPSAQLWDEAARTGEVPAVGPEQLAQFRADLAYWHAAALVMAPATHTEVQRQTVTALVGRAPIWLDGVWLWDVRDLR